MNGAALNDKFNLMIRGSIDLQVLSLNPLSIHAQSTLNAASRDLYNLGN